MASFMKTKSMIHRRTWPTFSINARQMSSGKVYANMCIFSVGVVSSMITLDKVKLEIYWLTDKRDRRESLRKNQNEAEGALKS